MDNKFYSLIGLAKRAGRVSVGYNKCEESVLYGNTSLIIASDDLSPNSLKKFKRNCEEDSIPLILDASSVELSRILGKEKTIKIVSIDDKGFSKKLLKLWMEK